MRGSISGPITQLLLAWRDGDEDAFARLVPLVYDELHRLASGYLRRERGDHTLQPTALVHEAYLRLVDQRSVDWESRGQFLALAARMMRRILVDHARRQRGKRRGGYPVLSLADVAEPGSERHPDLLLLDDALTELAGVHPQLASLVELRFFGGFTNEEISAVLGLSIPTLTRRWRATRAWLYRYLAAER